MTMLSETMLFGTTIPLLDAMALVWFLAGAAGYTALADQIACTWPGAEILSVNYLGASGNALQGGEAADIFARCLAPRFAVTLSRATRHYRIDRFQPLHSGDTAA